VADQEFPTFDRTAALRETLVSLMVIDDPESVSLRACLEQFAAEDVAAVLDDFEPDKKVAIFKAVGSAEAQAAVLEATDHGSRADIRAGLSEAERREVFEEMPVDDLVDQLEELPADEQERIIAELETEEAEDVRELRQYEPETAGGMMTPEFLSVPVNATSGEALATIQGNLNAEVISYVYVVESDEVLKGVVSIRDLLKARPETLVVTYMQTNLVRVNVETDREDVGAIVDKYNFVVVPVVDDKNSIRGVVTFDDVLDAVQDEHSEDMLRMAGTTAIHPYYEPIYIGVAKRLPFLLVTLSGAFGVLLILQHYRGVLENGWEDATILFALVVPAIHLISGLSGNVAVITSTVFVRAFAIGEIGRGRLLRAVIQEVAVGSIIALIMSAIVVTVLSLFAVGTYGYDIILVVAGGLCASVTWAALIGALVPVACRVTKVIDPAIASGPFVTIMVDVSASLIFFLFVVTFLKGWVAPAG
jgi:magnesium transporter